ncbi:MAG TPA: hypothetical protein VF669_09550 [Tepidisphaeraceae bacterium]|jgi:hypothetical protein
MSQPILLNYRGSAGLDDMNAFNARTNVGLKGDLLFRIYLTSEAIYFIKVGGSKQQAQVVAAQFGLLGILIGHFLKKRATQKTQEKLNAVAGVAPEQLLAADKVNKVAPVTECTEMCINPRSFLSGARFGTWTFRDAKGKKRTYTFDDADNFLAAVERLSKTFGEKVQVKAQLHPSRKKTIKIT